MQIKICGITNIEDAIAACDAGADALGFVFAEAGKKRNRYIEAEKALRIIEQLPPFIVSVAVVVNESLDNINQYLKIVDLIQLHGNEGPEYGDALRNRCVKVFKTSPDLNSETVNSYTSKSILLDTFIKNDPGGTGETADWNKAAEITAASDKPVILAGGLTPENVSEAIRAVKPAAVDASSGVEATPGKKDHERLRRFIDAAKTSMA